MTDELVAERKVSFYTVRDSIKDNPRYMGWPDLSQRVLRKYPAHALGKKGKLRKLFGPQVTQCLDARFKMKFSPYSKEIIDFLNYLTERVPGLVDHRTIGV